MVIKKLANSIVASNGWWISEGGTRKGGVRGVPDCLTCIEGEGERLDRPRLSAL